MGVVAVGYPILCKLGLITKQIHILAQNVLDPFREGLTFYFEFCSQESKLMNVHVLTKMSFSFGKHFGVQWLILV
jgi:hypothetical protein